MSLFVCLCNQRCVSSIQQQLCVAGVLPTSSGRVGDQPLTDTDVTSIIGEPAESDGELLMAR